MTEPKKKILVVVNRFHSALAELIHDLEQVPYEIHILTSDSKWLKYCEKTEMQSHKLFDQYRSFLNSYQSNVLRFFAGFLEHVRFKKGAKKWLDKIKPDLLVLPADHKDFFYYFATLAKCPSFLPQLTLYNQVDLLVGYKNATLSSNFILRFFQKKIFKQYENQWFKYREPFWYSMGKYLGGYRQRFISKGGNVSTFAVHGPAFADMYKKFDIPKRKIKVLGSIDDDMLLRNISLNRQTNKVNPKQIAILFFLPPLFGGEPSQSVINDLIILLQNLVDDGESMFRIALKPHPLDKKLWKSQSLNQFCITNSIETIETDGYASVEKLVDLVESFDLCVHSVSSVQFVLMAMQKPTLVFLSEKSPYYSADYIHFYNTYSIFTNNVDSFLSEIESFKRNPDLFQKSCSRKSQLYCSEYMMLDGHVKQRYIAECMRLIEKNRISDVVYSKP